jgi:hypothetical protein
MQNLNMTWDFGRNVNEMMAGKEGSAIKYFALNDGNANARLSSFLQNNFGSLLPHNLI